VELNASFYRFPYRNQILSWARKGKDLRWAVKVHRSVTHTHRFNEEAGDVWVRFRDAFAPLDPFIDFYLFQAPPKFSDADRVIAFAERAGLGERFAFEIRNAALLSDDDACRKLQEHVTLVSVDSPDRFNRIFPGRTIYLRMHGREGWYSHDYSEDELRETAGFITAADPELAYVFFNNDHAMLENAQLMRRVLEPGSPSGAL
jgi:uncharacterized protein YecE (DUF72 family)